MPSMPHADMVQPAVVQPDPHAHADTHADANAGVVVGVDTHRDTHVAVVVTPVGAMLGSQRFAATAAGYEQLLGWARGFGSVRQVGVEGTGSYGAGLTRALAAAGIPVREVYQPDRARRRRRGKTDTVDAEAAAHAVLAGRDTATPKTGTGVVEMIRVLKRGKDSAIKARTQAINQIKGLLVSATTELRESVTGLGTTRLVDHLAELQPVTPTDTTSATRHTLRLLARRVRHLSEEIHDLQQQLRRLLQAHTPRLLQPMGLGPDSAATLLITAGDNPDRLDDEASFAALCGASPVEASSGKTQRRRLNRGGNRQANAALYRIVVTRLRHDPRTRGYLDHRTTSGKTRREVIRCLKRYVAREVYPLLRPRTLTG